MFKKIFIIICLILTTSCLSRVEKRGYSFELSDHHLVKKGISNKETVVRLMGSPTFTSEIDNEELWIYYSEEVRKLLFLKPKIKKRKIITISFDKTNIANQIQHYSLDDGKNLSFSSKHTEVKAINEGFWSDIFGNIGQISAN